MSTPDDKNRAADLAFFGATAGPRWPDACGHGGYVATFEHEIRRPTAFPIAARLVQTIDIYVFDQDHWGPTVCLRHGAEGPDYYSPGAIGHFLANSKQCPAYEQARGILGVLGTFRWEPKAGARGGSEGEGRDHSP